MPLRGPSPDANLVFLRGVNFSNPVGASDWRIALYMPEFGFNTTVLGRGLLTAPRPGQVKLVSVPVCRLPVVQTLALSCRYAVEALRHEPDIIIVNPGVALAAALCKAVNARIQAVLDIRSIPVESRGCAGCIHRAYFEAVLRSGLFDACSVISQGMLDALDRQFALSARLPTAVWGSGFDQEIFVRGALGPEIRQKLDLDGKFVLMYHGSLSPARGLGEVIRGLRLLRDRGDADLQLVLIGHGAAKPALMALATELNVADQVRCVPSLAHETIPEWVAAADLGLDPLPDHPWWRHQSPLKVYEYLAMGKPVLATDLPCHRGISEAVILVPENQPSTLVEAILRIRSLPADERQRLSRVARRDAEQHTWRIRAQTLARFLHELMGRA
jgi:glycosyltransferase involved in cell wall biosynthesis